MVCFNQEERVAGLMFEVCPFLKEMKGGIKTLSGLWFDPNSTSGPARSYLLSKQVVKAGIVTRDTP